MKINEKLGLLLNERELYSSRKDAKAQSFLNYLNHLALWLSVSVIQL
jgi:hypothetical protein